ncbi:sensor histidine kinase [Streptomyces thermolilacinus]|uniref:histidine kinase n=1 Tax=Streptomyces thermolilacinus SPC6 TaxID=1306406 RepID=A0A1D3DP51_9ACTN|nr:sensor histidine kinase [Streptomyces thermolilacinus]OEJ94101.1 two-component sensor histidine kinase [Streptomyces thermolilacinus SPC6]
MALPSPVRRGRVSVRTADLAVTAVVTAFVAGWTVLSIVSAPAGSEPLSRTVLGWFLVAVGCGALLLRRSRPVAVAVVTLLASVVYYPTSSYDGPLMVTFALALYTTAAEGRFVAAVALASVTLLAVGLGEIRQDPGRRQIDDTSLVMLAGWLISLVAVGRAQRTRLAYLHEVEQRALAAEREQEARARQSATEERLRIAREVHDVLGHSLSLINVQSSAALHRLAKKPGPAEALPAATEALEAVKATSKDALRELRGTLGALRQSGEAAPTAPVSGLDRLDELVGRARAAGLDVTARTEGTPRPLPPALDLAAYRIVQESLTNVTRHARARAALVTLSWTDDELRLRIEDDGEGSPDAEARGSGLRGMAERARAFGGELTAGNTGHGFEVSARLPFTSSLTTTRGTE